MTPSHAMQSAIATQLNRYGPDGNTQPVSLAEAQAYCRDLAHTHYENFSVASWLLPKHLQQHFYNVYAYCRWADDLADEVEDREHSTDLLDWWETELAACYQDDLRHPVFIALHRTVQQFQIPQQIFADLLIAFRQDQHVSRYETTEQLLQYCRYSANPVGRIVLYLGKSHREECLPLSDKICTGLQLANFCQDVARDWKRGRIYLPLGCCQIHGVSEEDFQLPSATRELRSLLAEQVDYAEGLLRDGLPLVNLVNKDLRSDIRLFAQGGLAILAAIRKIDYDVLSQRPVVSKSKKLRLLVGSLLHRGLPRVCCT